MFVHWPPSQMLGLSSHSSISTGKNQIKTCYLYAMHLTIIMASKHFNALVNMMKTESLQITEWYIAKLSWWVSSSSPAKLSGKHSPLTPMGTGTNFVGKKKSLIEKKNTEPLAYHMATYNWKFLDTVHHCWSQWKLWSQIQWQKYQTLQSLKKPLYMQNTSTALKGGDKLETQSWTHDGNNYSTYISFTKRFYGFFSRFRWLARPAI